MPWAVMGLHGRGLDEEEEEEGGSEERAWLGKKEMDKGLNGVMLPHFLHIQSFS